MASKAWVMLAVVTGGLTLSVVSASLSNATDAITPAAVQADEVARLRTLVEATNADVAELREQLHRIELELQSLRGERREPGESP